MPPAGALSLNFLGGTVGFHSCPQSRLRDSLSMSQLLFPAFDGRAEMNRALQRQMDLPMLPQTPLHFEHPRKVLGEAKAVALEARIQG